jgi:hypothetical protein
MIACHESDHQQIISEREEEERRVENSHQHGAEIPKMQQKDEDGAKEFNQGDLRFVGAVRSNGDELEEKPLPLHRSGSVRVSAYWARS